MLIFWSLSAGLIGLALVFIWWPLLRAGENDTAPAPDALNLEVFRQRLAELDADRDTGFLDQDQYHAAKNDLERELLHDLDHSIPNPVDVTGRFNRAVFLGLTFLIPLSAVALYWHLGNQKIISQLTAAATAPAAPAAADPADAPSLEVLVQKLEARLKTDPTNLDGWLMLGRTQFALEARQQGLAAIAKAYELAPTQIEVMLAYAEALAAASDNRSLAGRPTELIDAVLAREPSNPTARWLRGMVAYQQDDFSTAIATWQTIRAELEPGGEEANNLQLMIDEATRRGAGAAPAGNSSPAAITADSRVLAEAPVHPAEAAVTVTEPVLTPREPLLASADVAAHNGAAVTVTVALDPTLAAQTSPDQAVFVFARAANGPPMPLAAVRLTVKDLPQTVTLDDSSAVTPALRLSAFTEVIVGARISASGEARPQVGDLEGETAPLPLRTTEAVTVTIDRERR
jgi:cytochrome c-type biogenesis protein CcmH